MAPMAPSHLTLPSFRLGSSSCHQSQVMGAVSSPSGHGTACKQLSHFSNLPTPPSSTIYSYGDETRYSNDICAPRRQLQLHHHSHHSIHHQHRLPPINALRSYTSPSPPLALDSVLNHPDEMPTYICLTPGTDGDLHIVGLRYSKAEEQSEAGPLTPPPSQSEASSPRSSSNDGASVDTKVTELATPMDVEYTENNLMAFAEICEWEMAAQEFGAELVTDLRAIEMTQPVKRGRVEDEEAAEEEKDHRRAKKARTDGGRGGRKMARGLRVKVVDGSRSIKGGKPRIVWTAEAEAAYLMAQLSIPVLDSKWKLPVFKQALGRNQLIAAIVSIVTGTLFDRKSISSHGQTIRDSKDYKGYPLELLDILSKGERDTEMSKADLANWVLPSQLASLIGLPKGVRAKEWAVPNVVFVDEVSGVELMVPAGIDKIKARTGHF